MGNSLGIADLRSRFVNLTELEYPQLWACTHGCTHAIQLVNHTTKKVELETCELNAEKIAGFLLEEIDKAARV